MSIHFHVGQKVVCVNAERTSWKRKKFMWLIPYTVWGSELEEGAVYTISDVFEGTDVETGRAGIGLWLAGFENYAESGFGAWRFRPVVKRKADISVFTAMLTKTRISVRA